MAAASAALAEASSVAQPTAIAWPSLCWAELLAHAQEQYQGHLNQLRAAVQVFPRGVLSRDGFEQVWNEHIDDLRT